MGGGIIVNLYLLLGITMIFLSINYLISDKDILNPAFVFAGVNFIYIVTCCISNNLYRVEICAKTIYVISVGLVIFTISNIIFRHFSKCNKSSIKFVCESIKVNKWFVIFLLLLMVIVAFVMARHIISVASRYGGEGNLALSIGIYDNLSKFSDISTGTPILYSIMLFPIRASAYIFVAIIINNYFAKKRFDKFLLLYCALYLPFTLLSGGRSELIRFLMAVLVDILIIKRKVAGSYKRENFKNLIRIVLFVVCMIIISFPVLNLIGKSRALSSNAPLMHLYKYIGGPIYNLDSFLSSIIYKSEYWGQETFQGLYSFLGNIFHIKQFSYRLHIPISIINGIDLGNVYTMYYMFIEDFGYAGLLLVFPICFYYFYSYGKLIDYSKNKTPLGINLFVYSYMFNALTMLLFSNRFYENMLSYNFLKLWISFYIVWIIIRKVRFKCVT